GTVLGVSVAGTREPDLRITGRTGISLLRGDMMFNLEVDDVGDEQRDDRPGVAKASKDFHLELASHTGSLASQDRRRRQEIGILLRIEPHGDDLHAEIDIGIERRVIGAGGPRGGASMIGTWNVCSISKSLKVSVRRTET